jgi:SWI/SNF-related matrix-associated actin-dependent regulator of chromatin subfamily A member 5
MMNAFEKLWSIRERQDISIPRPPNLRESVQNSRGDSVPLELRPYQQQMVVHALAVPRFVIGDDCGLGKTIESIAGLCHIWKKDPSMKVVVLTKKSSVPQWEDEFNKFTQGVKILVAVGGAKKREEAQKKWQEHEGPVVLVQGYTSACNDFGTIQHFEGHTLVLDEVTVVKNPAARVHKICKHYSEKSARCWGLTATLIKNNLLEGYGIFKVVKPELFPFSKNAFVEQYCITKMQRVAGGRMVPQIVGYAPSAIRRFKDKIQGTTSDELEGTRPIAEPSYMGRPKHSVAKDLPTLVTKTVKVGLTNFQHSKYQEALAGLLEMGDGDEKETTQLTALIYCQEIVNHPALIGFDATYQSEKLDTLLEMLTEDGELHDEKVIVFTRFKEMVNVAIPALEKEGVKCVRVTGSEDEQARRQAMKSFQNPDDPTRVIFITMAGGDAINLQAAKALVFYDSPWSAGDYLQILGRMIRIGSGHDSCYAIHLVCKDTIDDRVMQVVRKKMRLIEQVLGERVKGSSSEEDIIETGSDIKDLFNAMVLDARSNSGRKVIQDSSPDE